MSPLKNEFQVKAFLFNASNTYNELLKEEKNWTSLFDGLIHFKWIGRSQIIYKKIQCSECSHFDTTDFSESESEIYECTMKKKSPAFLKTIRILVFVLPLGSTIKRILKLLYHGKCVLVVE